MSNDEEWTLLDGSGVDITICLDIEPPSRSIVAFSLDIPDDLPVDFDSPIVFDLVSCIPIKALVLEMGMDDSAAKAIADYWIAQGWVELDEYRHALRVLPGGQDKISARVMRYAYEVEVTR